MQKRWKCLICGYIHVGDEPPETCPVCGAASTQFVLLDSGESPAVPSLVDTFQLHPVAAHFPGGLVPTAALFLLLSFLLAIPGLEAAAFWLVATATAAVPVSIGSGLHDWWKHFGGRRAPIFFRKIGLALVLLSLGLAAVAVRAGTAGLAAHDGWPFWLFALCLAGMIVCVVFLGHYGTTLAAQRAAVPSPADMRSPAGIPDAWSRVIIAQVPDAVLVADASGIIRLWNRGAERIFGIPSNRAVGRSLDLIVPETLRQRHWDGWARVMQTGETRYGQELLRVPALRWDGTRISAEFSIVMLKDAAGRVEGVAAILRDVSEQWAREKRLQEQLAACRDEEPT